MGTVSTKRNNCQKKKKTVIRQLLSPARESPKNKDDRVSLQVLHQTSQR